MRNGKGESPDHRGRTRRSGKVKTPRRKPGARGTRQESVPFPRYAHQANSVSQPRIQTSDRQSAKCGI